MEESDWHGITYDPGRRNWKARIHFDGKEQYIGRYSTAYEAALAYDQAARLINETQEISVAAWRRTRPLNFPHLRPHDKSLDARLLSIFKITPEVAAAVAAGTTALALKAQNSTGAEHGALHMAAANMAASAPAGADPAHDHVLRHLAAAAAAHDAAASDDDDGAAEAAAALTAMGSMGSLGPVSKRRRQQQHSQQQRATAAVRWGAAGGGRVASGSSRAGASLQEQQLRPRPGSRSERLAAARAEPMQEVLPVRDTAEGEDSMVWEATPPESASPSPAPAPGPSAAAADPQHALVKCEQPPEADKQSAGDAEGVQQQQTSTPAASLLQPIALFVLRAVFPATPPAAELPLATSSGHASLSNGAAAGSADASQQQGPGPRVGGSSSSPVSSVAGSGAQRRWREERMSSRSGSVESEAAETAAAAAAAAAAPAACAAAAASVPDLTSPRDSRPLSSPAPQQHHEELQQEQQASPQAPLQAPSGSVPAANPLQSRVHLLLQQLITQCQQRQEQLQQQPAPLPVQQLPLQLRAPDLHTSSWPPQQPHGQVLSLSPAAVLQQLLPAVAGGMAAATPPAAAVSPAAMVAAVGIPGSGGPVGMLSRIGSAELLLVANSCLHEIIDMRLAVLMAPQHSSSLAVLQAHLAAAQQQRQQGWMAPAPGACVSMDEAQSALPMPPERIVALSMMKAFLQLVGDAAGAQGLDRQAECQSVLGALNQLQQALSGLQRVTAAASVHPAASAAACLGEWKAGNLGLSPRMAVHPAVDRFVELL